MEIKFIKVSGGNQIISAVRTLRKSFTNDFKQLHQKYGK